MNAFRQILSGFADQTAIVTADGTQKTYAELLADADVVGKLIQPSGGVFLLEAKNDYGSVVAYVAALITGVPVFLREPRQQIGPDPLLEAFPVNVVLRGLSDERTVEVLSGAAPADIHPDLAVLLSTSGSTGNPKLVKLSDNNILSNALAIAEYLKISVDDRACLILPLYYSYGMSVLNSHLLTGASVYLCATPVNDPGFVADFNAQGCTSFAGVPFTFETLEKRRFGDEPMPTLRYATQAGGKLSNRLVQHFATVTQKMDAAFYVMYGQTEASPRMAYLPPEQAFDYPDAIGVPIPGGKLSLIDEGGAPIGGTNSVGELVFEGPGVMMGYAITAEDLALPADPPVLVTGDLAMRNDAGLFSIVGRKSRFLKFSGIRVDLSDIEKRMTAAGYEGVATGEDGLLVMAITDRDLDNTAINTVLSKLPIMPTQVVTLNLPEIPRLSSGKIDYPALKSAGKAKITDRPDTADNALDGLISDYRFIFPSAEIDKSQSFNDLSGDSLNYVQAASAIEGRLGFLPEDWENLSIGGLAGLSGAKESAAKAGGTNLAIELLVRALAPILVTLTHAGLTTSLGGAMLLYFLGGIGFWRFQRVQVQNGDFRPVIRNYTNRILVPYYVMLVLIALVFGMANLRQFIPINNYLGGFPAPLTGTLLPYWFIEAYLQSIIVVLLLFAVPAVRGVVKTMPAAAGWCFYGATVAVALISSLPLQAGWVYWPTPNMILHIFALGFVTCSAKTSRDKALAASAIMVSAVIIYPAHHVQAIGFTIGAMLLLFAPPVKFPDVVSKVLNVVAPAGFAIYLVHIPVFRVMHAVGVPNLINPAIAVAVGVALNHYVPPAFRWVKARVKGEGKPS